MRVQARVIALCSWAKYFILTVPFPARCINGYLTSECDARGNIAID